MPASVECSHGLKNIHGHEERAIEDVAIIAICLELRYVP